MLIPHHLTFTFVSTMKKNLLIATLVFLGCFFGGPIFAQTNSIELKNGSGTLLSSHNSITAAYAAIPATISNAYIIEITSTYTGSNETYPIQMGVRTGSSASNTITLRPASGISNISIAISTATNVINMDDADYVIIDGRAGGTGTTRALTISQSNTGAFSNIQMINGATNNIIRYCNFFNGSTTSTGRIVFLSTSASNSTGNSFNLIEHCRMEGSRYGINLSGTAANPNRKNKVYGCEILNSTFTGMWIQANTAGIEVDSTSIYYTSSFTSATTPYGLLFDSQTDTAIITRNKIYDLNPSGTSAIAGIIIRSVSGTNLSRIHNNMISLTKSNASTSVDGIDYGGTVLTNAEIYFNTIRIGGTLSSGGTSGNVVSAPFFRDASNASNVFDLQNNIFINERSGGNSGTQHVALAMNNTNGTITIDYNTYNSSSANLTRWGTTVNTTLAAHQAIVPSGNELNTNDVTVNTVSATDLHIAGASLGDFFLKATPISGITKDIDNNPRGGSTYRGADDNPLYPIVGKKNDIGVLSIDEPAAGICGSPQTVKVTVKNFGTNQVDTFTVNWSINGTTQTPVTFYQMLDTVLGSGSTTAQVTLGTFATTSGVVYNIKAWTSNPNTSVDPDKKNDSAITNYKLGLAAGTYTIGGTSPDYATLAAAATDLNAYGICGPVVFNIRAGTYNEKLALDQIPGTSATNTVTFKSESGNKTSVTISSAAAANATDNYTVQLKGTDNVILQDITIERSGTGTNSTVISIDGVVENVKIHGNTLKGPYSSATDANGVRSHIFGTTAATTKNIEIYNNLMDNNSNGVWLNTSTTTRSTGTKIYNNEVRVNYTGIFVAGQYNPEITGNKIIRFDQGINVEYFGISMNIVDSSYLVSNNLCESNRGYGIRLRDCNGYNGNEGRVINNMVVKNYAGTSNVFGISNETGGSFQLFAHNTCMLNVDYTGTTANLGGRSFNMPTTTTNAYNNVRVLNNIFTTMDGVAAWFTTANITAVTELDYNLYYTTDQNLTYVSTYLADFATFQTNTGKEVHGYNFLPNFAGTNNAHILFLSKFAFGRNDLNIPLDFDGDTRCASLPTIGADEYSSGTTSLPIASFIGPNSVVTGDRSYFLFNGNLNQLAVYKWYVNGTLAASTPNLIYSFPTAGTYDIMQVAENCSGKDTLVISYTVANPTVVPTVNFSSDRNQIFINESVKMTDLSLNGPTKWSWSVSPDNGVIFTDSTEQDPIILFTEPGKYEICLVAENAIGAGAARCRTSYIEVFPMISMCTDASSNYERGKISDDGGPTSNYAANQNCSFFINPCASEVTLKFTEWTNTDADDKLTIYDGDTTDPANIIATITGGMTNPGGSTGFTAKTGRMWLLWRTDATLQYAGFAAEWNAVPTSVSPTVAGFTVSDTVYEDSPVAFTNSSTGNGLTYFWDFDYPNYEVDNQGSYTRENPIKTFGLPGTYDVFLTSTNCLGSDTFIKKVVVVSPTTAPTAVDFTATLTKLNVGEITQLTDLSGHGPSNWRWEITPSNGVLFLDAPTTYNPRVTFSFGGMYTVKLVVGNAVGKDSITKTNYIQVLEYCQPNVLGVNTDVTIRRVVLAGIDQSSDYGVTKYSDFTGNGQIAQVNIGANTPISIERNTNNERVNYAAWIDLNQDGDFEDSAERVLFDSASIDQVFNGSIVVPSIAMVGPTRMRVAVSRANLTTLPCGPVVVGEYEDYKIEISTDNIAPVITILGPNPVNVEAGYGYTDSGATAMDNVDGNITSKIVVTGVVDTLSVGVYSIIYTVTDSAGNAITAQRIVNVTPDVTKPILTLKGSDTIRLEVKNTYTEAGFDAIDNPFGTILDSVVMVTGTVDTTKIGTYVLTYTVTDASGNTSTLQRVIIISDTTKPVITLIGNAIINHEVNTKYIDEGAIVTDNYNTGLTYTVTGTVNTNILGTNILTYTAVDASGNVASTVTRTVNVVDRTAPVIKLVGSEFVNVLGGNPYTDSGYIVSDNFNDSAQITVTVLTNYVNRTTVEGLYYIQYQATDQSGNVSLSARRAIDVRGTNSINDVLGLNTMVYPNPSNGNFTIEVSQAFEAGSQITITNLLGAIVYQANPSVGDTKATVNIDGIAAGIYTVNITHANRTEITKIVVE